MGTSEVGGAIALLALLGAACQRTPAASAEPPGSTSSTLPLSAATAAPPAGTPSAHGSTGPHPPTRVPAGAPEALAIPNAATGAIELVLADRPTPCGPHQPFPDTCDPAWRVRIDLLPEHQRPGRYPLGPELSPFSYLDAQAPNAGVWERGTACKNLDAPFVGWLELVVIDADGITGVLSGAGDADGPFRARRCPACRGTGMTCSTNSECCNAYCFKRRCQP